MRWFYCLIVVFLLTSCEPGKTINQSSSTLAYSKDGTTWQDEEFLERGKFWIKKSITINEPYERSSPLGLGVSILGSYKVYWDGDLIGTNGLPGASKQEEQIGKIKSFHFLPRESVTIGDHEVLIEYSNFYGAKFRIYLIHLTEFEDFFVEPLLATAFIHIYAGLFLIIGLFYFVRYFINRDEPTSLAFSLVCLFFFGLIIIEYLITYYAYPYPMHWTRLQVIYGVTVGISLLTPLFFLYMFDFKFKLFWMIPTFVLFIGLFFSIPYGYDFATGLTMISGFIISAIICGRAKYLERSGAFINLAVLVPLSIVLIVFVQYYDFLLYVGFGFLISVNLIRIALREREARKEKEAAKLTSSRLQLELLKKNIQPHFFNNSITSAIDWIERNPPKGVELLFALSKEFDILNDISDKKLIPVIKELELCRAHLEIMSFRKEEMYVLETKGIDEFAMIPPAILLTIIENGITHKSGEQDGLTFYVTATKEDEKTRYHILADGDVHKTQNEINEGTGSRYIKARLQESYPDDWHFESKAGHEGWETTFEVRDI